MHIVRVVFAALVLTGGIACDTRERGSDRASVEASAAPRPSPSDEPSEPTADEVAVEERGEESTATSVPDLGAPEFALHDQLRFKQWAQAGGEVQTERAPEGEAFLVVTFPETAREMSVSYVSSDYELRTSASAPLRPHAVTVGGGYEHLGADVFQKEVFMTTRQCAAGSPFAVAFLVPRNLKSATIVVKGVAVQWTS